MHTKKAMYILNHIQERQKQQLLSDECVSVPSLALSRK